jgi:predicted MFS family arabinose efflux permease
VFIVAVLWAAFFAANFNIAMMIPLLPFIERDIGLTSAQAGWTLAAFPITALIGNLALGPFIDRFGRKRFIVLGSAVSTVVFLGTAASHSAAGIIAGRAACGLFMPMLGASTFAAIADYFPPADRARVAGYVTAGAPIAFLCSMSIGVLLGGLFAWQLPLLLLASWTAILACCASRLPPTPRDALASEPVSARSYQDRLLSLSLDPGTRLLLLTYFCWAAAIFVFMGLYPSWVVQRGLAGHGIGPIGTMLLLGETGGLLGALLSGRLARAFRHPLHCCALAAIIAALVVATVPYGAGHMAYQALAYGVFAFVRDLMLALLLGGAMLLVHASQRGSLNAILNAIYQTGATLGGLASAWLYALRPDFTADALLAGLLFAGAAALLWTIPRLTAR